MNLSYYLHTFLAKFTSKPKDTSITMGAKLRTRNVGDIIAFRRV